MMTNYYLQEVKQSQIFMHFKQAKLGNYIFIFILTAILTVNEEKMFVKNIQLAIYQGVLICVYLVK